MNKHKIGAYLAYVLAVLFLLAAAGEIFHLPSTITLLSANDVVNWVTVIGLGLVVSVVLYVYPRTKNFGTLLLSSYMGGAILFHMSLGQPFVLQSILLIVIWVIAWMRDPRIILDPAHA